MRKTKYEEKSSSLHKHFIEPYYTTILKEKEPRDFSFRLKRVICEYFLSEFEHST